MKRIIVDLKKLTPNIFTLLTKKFPDGYNDKDIIVFENHHAAYPQQPICDQNAHYKKNRRTRDKLFECWNYA